MYDRFVHLAYGLLLYPFFYRLFQVWLPQLSKLTLFLLVIQFVMASSLIYEWIQWFIAMGLSPEDAENYNGQQGDILGCTPRHAFSHSWCTHHRHSLSTEKVMIFA